MGPRSMGPRRRERAVTDALLAIDVEGSARAHPLAPTVLYAEGEVARGLARRLAARLGEPVDLADTGSLVGVASRERGYLVLSGPTEVLPWCEGARYFGIDPEAPRLRLSTTRAPSLADGAPLSASVLERALVAQHPRARGALLVMRGRLLALGEARSIDRAPLLAFAACEVRP